MRVMERREEEDSSESSICSATDSSEVESCGDDGSDSADENLGRKRFKADLLRDITEQLKQGVNQKTKNSKSKLKKKRDEKMLSKIKMKP